jgi:hypothetical protein
VTYDSLRGVITVQCVLDKSVESAELAILLEPTIPDQKKNPAVVQMHEGGETPMKSAGGEQRSQWFTIAMPKGEYLARFTLKLPAGMEVWRGEITCYAVCKQAERALDVSIAPGRDFVEAPMPPRSLPAATIERIIKLGQTDISFEREH